MQITITMELSAENLDRLKVFCQDTAAKTEVVPEEPKAPKKTTKKAEPKPEETRPEEPKAKPETAPAAEVPFNEEKAPAYTHSDIRAVALKISKAGKADELKKIFAKFDATKLSEIAPENYPELMKELSLVNA